MSKPLPHPLVTAIQPVVDAVGATLVPIDDIEPSDVPLVWEDAVVGAVRMPPLHGALDRLIDTVETELGAPLPLLSREDKQKAVRLLDERGAFILRRAVEDVADAMGVSRITVYNYLNAIHR
jgi:HTH domain